MASEKSQESRSDQVFRNDRSWISALGDTATLPRYLSSDHDPLFEFHRWRANLRILEVREVKTVTYVPLSHPFIERLVGTIRREYLDEVPFWNARDLQRTLHEFQAYYNRDRFTPDASAETPSDRIACLDDYQWETHCRGLNQLPVAA